MPEKIPTEHCLNVLFASLRTADLLNLPGDALLTQLDELVEGRWLPNYPECRTLLRHPQSMALATSLVLLWPISKWNEVEAVHEFRNIATELTDAWKKVSHTDPQKLRKTVDHAVVTGIRRNWAAARGMLASAILGLIGPSITFLAGRPLARNQRVDGEDARGLEAEGLIPELNGCWGGDFKLDGVSHVGAIYNRLLQPFMRLPVFPNGQQADFTWEGDGVVLPFSTKPVPAGSRRNFRLDSGAAKLLHNGVHVAYVGASQRLILRMLDDDVAQLQLAQRRGASVGGRTLEFCPQDKVSLQFCADEGSALEVWNCTCGALACDEQHRLSAWNPGTMVAKTTLSSFLATAVKGPMPGFHINSFIQGMYYALLCNGE